jgi:hypothetical protein
MINPHHFRIYVVRPTLVIMDMHSKAAENLLVGTAITESHLTFLKQHGPGPACGVFQIEPTTALDVMRYVASKPKIQLPRYTGELEYALKVDLGFQTQVARLKYWMQPEPLPHEDNIMGLAEYWKTYYNTPKGAGQVEDFVLKYEQNAL